MISNFKPFLRRALRLAGPSVLKIVSQPISLSTKNRRDHLWFWAALQPFHVDVYFGEY